MLLTLASAAWPVAVGAEEAESAQPGLSLHVVSDLAVSAIGGIRQDGRLLGRLDLRYSSDSDFLGISGAHAEADLVLLHGGGLSERLVGDAQTVSNIDAPHAARLFEAWVETPLGERLRGKAGQIDLNSEFDIQRIGLTFLNSSFGIGPDFSQSGSNGPSIFPATAFGVVVAAESKVATFRVGIFDGLAGDPENSDRFLPVLPGRAGALLVAEADLKVGKGGELQLGGWSYPQGFDRIGGLGRDTSAGGYVQFEQRLTGNDRISLDGWIRTGFATASVNPIGHYVGGGMRWGSDASHLGFGIAHARLGDPAFRSVAQRRAETTLELTAFHQITDWLAVQPDLQIVHNPSWRNAADFVVAALRLHLGR